ncbi:hypothetical protein N7488_009007 [Penicillium malachiteum]|nr:hypothetical protein N7488_009007 [Penicillium malachiteum]
MSRRKILARYTSSAKRRSRHWHLRTDVSPDDDLHALYDTKLGVGTEYRAQMVRRTSALDTSQELATWRQKEHT